MRGRLPQPIAAERYPPSPICQIASMGHSWCASPLPQFALHLSAKRNAHPEVCSLPIYTFIHVLICSNVCVGTQTFFVIFQSILTPNQQRLVSPRNEKDAPVMVRPSVEFLAGVRPASSTPYVSSIFYLCKPANSPFRSSPRSFSRIPSISRRMALSDWSNFSATFAILTEGRQFPSRVFFHFT